MRAEVKAAAKLKISRWSDEAKACRNPLIAAQLAAQANGGAEILDDIEQAEAPKVPDPRYSSSPAPRPPDTPFRAA